MQRVVLDTNVLISALLFKGPTNKLVALWKHNTIVLLASGSIVSEYLRVFSYPKFGLTPEEIEGLFYNDVLPYIESIHISTTKKVILEDPSDDQFLACALSGKASALISGDHHLLQLGRYEDIPILTIKQFLDQLR